MTVDSGTDLTSADTSTEPAVIYESEPSKFYTLAFVEADDYTFFIRSNGLTRNWLVVNIPGSDISRGNSTATPYLGAKIPECGSTRYVFALAEQPGEIPGLGVSASREKFDMKNYFANNNMTLIGVNFFMTLSND
ncbi:Phosphatidylethanolamine-binding protein 1, partial [Linderina pennispora]